MTKRKKANISPIPILVLLLALGGFLLGQHTQKATVLGATADSRTNREFYVPLGAGFGENSEWTTVAGSSAYIDTTNFAKMKKVTFEASVHQPKSSQRIWVRLQNATDGRVIANSELSTDNTGPITLISPNVILDYGNKLYQVQMKTQLSGLTNLTQARIHIITY